MTTGTPASNSGYNWLGISVVIAIILAAVLVFVDVMGWANPLPPYDESSSAAGLLSQPETPLCDRKSSELSPNQIAECQRQLSEPSVTPDPCDRATGLLSPNQIRECNARTPLTTEPTKTTTEPTVQPTQQPAATTEPQATPPTTVPTTNPQPTAAPEQQPAGQDDSFDALSTNGQCTNIPTEDNMPRSIVDTATYNQWFHPIYDADRYQKSGGFEGQWSWFNSICLLQGDGGRFVNFENQDAHFRFRHDEVNANVAFAVMTNPNHRAQFMNGKDNYKPSMNIRLIPGSQIEVFNPITGKTLATQAVSQGGDLLIILPENGKIAVRFHSVDNAKTFEAVVWFGPHDRDGQAINTLDASTFGY